jgi:uncharacterized SAM-binding protein YcdF (DUF218 family)
MRSRLVVVLGYSNRNNGLHDICAARLRRAEGEAVTGDVVLLSGWARRRSPASEAALMAEAWNGPDCMIAVDHRARSTSANCAGAAVLARRLAVERVLLVTSGWHARRATALLRLALRGSRAQVMVATTADRPSLATCLREAACWLLVPAVAVRRIRAAPLPAHR